MEPIEFCYWLQGFFELAYADVNKLTPEQVSQINEHLQLVFEKRTGVIAKEHAKDLQQTLQKIHAPEKEIHYCSASRKIC